MEIGGKDEYPDPLDNLARIYADHPGQSEMELNCFENAETLTWTSAGILPVTLGGNIVLGYQQKGGRPVWSVFAGRREREDGSARITALREFNEEYGVRLQNRNLRNPAIMAHFERDLTGVYVPRSVGVLYPVVFCGLSLGAFKQNKEVLAVKEFSLLDLEKLLLHGLYRSEYDKVWFTSLSRWRNELTHFWGIQYRGIIESLGILRAVSYS